MEHLIQFCDDLIHRQEPIRETQGQVSQPAKPAQPYKHDQPAPIINRMDIENLSNYVQIWTDVISIEETERQFQESSYHDKREFISDNHLYHMGFFYVKVNTNLSTLEFFNLIAKIPWETLKLPGMEFVSYASIAQLLGEHSETIAIQLLSIGDFLKFWQLVNPYTLMSGTHDNTRLLMAGMGTLGIYISPHFIDNCKELIETVNLTSTSDQN